MNLLCSALTKGTVSWLDLSCIEQWNSEVFGASLYWPMEQWGFWSFPVLTNGTVNCSDLSCTDQWDSGLFGAFLYWPMGQYMYFLYWPVEQYAVLTFPVLTNGAVSCLDLSCIDQWDSISFIDQWDSEQSGPFLYWPVGQWTVPKISHSHFLFQEWIMQNVLIFGDDYYKSNSLKSMWWVLDTLCAAMVACLMATLYGPRFFLL